MSYNLFLLNRNIFDNIENVTESSLTLGTTAVVDMNEKAAVVNTESFFKGLVTVSPLTTLGSVSEVNMLEKTSMATKSLASGVNRLVWCNYLYYKYIFFLSIIILIIINYLGLCYVLKILSVLSISYLGLL